MVGYGQFLVAVIHDGVERLEGQMVRAAAVTAGDTS